MPAGFLNNELRETAKRLAHLAADLRWLADGNQPTPVMLYDAPMLDGWLFHPHTRPALIGVVHNHPLIGDGRRTHTSEIYAVDAAQRWARTLNRFYLLGAQTRGPKLIGGRLGH